MYYTCTIHGLYYHSVTCDCVKEVLDVCQCQRRERMALITVQGMEPTRQCLELDPSLVVYVIMLT